MYYLCSDQDGFVNFDGVVKNIDQLLKKKFPDVTINVLYVCGAGKILYLISLII